MDLHIKIVSDAGSLSPREYYFTGGPVTIGRAPENAVELDSKSVSRMHLLLDVAGDEWRVTHQGSTPSLVNGAELDKDWPTPLTTGDLIQVDEFALKCFLVEEEPTRTSDVYTLPPSPESLPVLEHELTPTPMGGDANIPLLKALTEHQIQLDRLREELELRTVEIRALEARLARMEQASGGTPDGPTA